jgi:dipeptidase E
MNLILTSFGLSTENLLEECRKLITKPTKQVKALILYIKYRDPPFNEHMNIITQQFLELGILEENIQSFDLYAENPPNLNDVDIVFMFGGNENRYIDQIRKQGLYSKIRDFVDRNGLYIGVSAGAIIMGPTVDIEPWSGASNDIGLVDKSGFGYVDFITVPHVDTRRGRGQKVVDFHASTGHKMMYLTDKQGILVIDDMYKII